MSSCEIVVSYVNFYLKLNCVLIARAHLIKSCVSFMFVRCANRVKNGIAIRSSYLTFLLHRRRVNTPVKDRAINHKFQLS